MSDPADEPAYRQLGEEGNVFNKAENPDALIEGNRVATAGDMESSEQSGTDEAATDRAGAADSGDGDSANEQPGYEGEAPNAPLASQGSRDGTAVGDDQNDD
jgi:hypothetical protein